MIDLLELNLETYIYVYSLRVFYYILLYYRIGIKYGDV